ncbi:hypothetical protein G6F57_003144 [Rhizopus arrhizus]|uniref:BLOC-1-related complex subunit 5 n=1 Tax=Rhizopus oryzae TaxID=64495 RepID=A0A9P7BQV2_RHIOR|nr:hypothetical protein G6F24_010456 [Rhizopus arrhizus]KAG1413386.1 hypothetical protein G6F58_007521 [Rhizopus delemar]KAG0784442.1 hypothetical protein G6F21_009903 [Rhizopus arrhizus]KAG0813213.1 hypothetical protein G6F20_005735 [Rhizopus arrhizus]KAG0824016.1 hypothetical protein G6F19_010548 [Rhizopus arrhizus]
MPTPSPSQSSLSIPSLNNEQLSAKQDSDKDSEKDDNTKEEGVIEVVKRSETTIDDELEYLQKIKKVEPLIKAQEKKFSLESMITFKPNVNYELNEQIKDKSFSDLLTEILSDLQAHVESQMTVINTKQHIRHADELSQSMSQSMVFALNQAKLASEKFSEVATIKEKSNKIHQQTSHVFKALFEIEKYLDPEDRITNRERWPHLNELYRNASKRTSPSIERLITSNSTEPSTTLESITTNVPLLEDATDAEKQEEGTATNSNTSRISFVPSTALSSLRGLSSMSISKYSQL